MDIQKKIILEQEKNSKTNQIDNHGIFPLWKEYDNVRIKLLDHNHALEELTQKVLKLDLFNPQKINPIKERNTSKNNDKVKIFHKRSYQENHKNELFIIKKLLLINLKSFQVMQRLYQENYDLQKSLDKTYQLATQQKQQLQKIKQENEILVKDIIIFNKFDNVTNKILIQTYSRPGFQTCLIPNCKSILQQTGKPSEFSSKEIAIKADSTSKSNYTNNLAPLSICCKQLSHSFGLQLASDRTISYNIPIQSQNIPHVCIGSALQELHLGNFLSSKQLMIENKNKTQEASPKEELINLSSLQVKNIKNIKDSNDFFVFEDTKSLLLLQDYNFLTKNVSEFVKMTNPLMFYENIKMNSESYQFLDGSNKKKVDAFYFSHNSAINEMIEHISNEKTNFHSYNSTQKTSDGMYNSLISQSFTINTNISVGVRDGSKLFCDQQSQLENNSFTKIILADEKRHKNVAKITFEYKTGKEKIKTIKNASDATNSRHDFKRSLQALREVIESCKRTSEQIPEKSYKTKIKESKQDLMKPSTKEVIKNEIKRRKKIFSNSNKEYKKISKIPEMNKTYQIVLENNISKGMSLKFMKLNNSNIQMLVINNPYNSNNFSKFKLFAK